VTLADGKLANAIAKNGTINVLNFEGNNSIGLEGVKHLAAAIKENDTLEKLFLDGNNIGDEGAKYIAEMLAVNKSLQIIG
jgi:NLR family CARD domain-containing protein 3